MRCYLPAATCVYRARAVFKYANIARDACSRNIDRANPGGCVLCCTFGRCFGGSWQWSIKQRQANAGESVGERKNTVVAWKSPDLDHNRHRLTWSKTIIAWKYSGARFVTRRCIVADLSSRRFLIRGCCIFILLPDCASSTTERLNRTFGLSGCLGLCSSIIRSVHTSTPNNTVVANRSPLIPALWCCLPKRLTVAVASSDHSRGNTTPTLPQLQDLGHPSGRINGNRRRQHPPTATGKVPSNTTHRR